MFSQIYLLAVLIRMNKHSGHLRSWYKPRHLISCSFYPFYLDGFILLNSCVLFHCLILFSDLCLACPFYSSSDIYAKSIGINQFFKSHAPFCLNHRIGNVAIFVNLSDFYYFAPLIWLPYTDYVNLKPIFLSTA